MKNWFGRTKKETIPIDNAQEVTVLDSWTLKWETQGSTYGSSIVNHKAFIDEPSALEYEKQLKESALFLKVWVKTDLTKN